MPNTLTAAGTVANGKSAAKPSMIRKHLAEMKNYFQEVDDFPLEVEEKAQNCFKEPFPVRRNIPAQSVTKPAIISNREAISAESDSDDVHLIDGSEIKVVATPPRKIINVNLVNRR